MEKFPFTDCNKRYHTLHYHLKQHFPMRVFKAAVDAGFSCPNIDGTCGYGGCSYCRNGGTEFTESALLSVSEQISLERERIHRKWKNAGVIAYFQSHTNTYAPVETLEKLYNEALNCKDVCGLSIATRADALPDDGLDLLESLSKQTYLTVELGLQTVSDETAFRINRGHTYETFKESFLKLRSRNIRTCVHLINGLPGESAEQMIQSAKTIAKLRPDAIKLHSLHILKGTKLGDEYLKNPFPILSREEYIEVVCRQLEYFPPETVIERLTGDGAKDYLLAPDWSRNKISVLGGIDLFLTEHDFFQGELFNCL